MRSVRSYIQALLLVLAVTCVSCRQELCYDHFPSMHVTFDWEQEWERDYGMNHRTLWDPALHRFEYDELRPDMPEWINMIRYFDDGRITESFLYPEGKKFEVEADQPCSILLYNGDTEYIILSDVASLHDVRATSTTRTRASAYLQAMQELYQVTRTTNPPDVIYASYIESVPGITNHEVHFLPVKMQPLVYTYLVSFEFDKGIHNVALARGALGGMAEGVYLRTGVTTDETAIILFDCDVYDDACRSQVRSFGIPAFPDSYFGRAAQPNRKPYTLNLEVRLRSGKTKEFTFDITDQIENQPRGGVIRVGGIEIEDEAPPQGSSGFDVDVTDWDDNAEQIDLPIQPFKSV